MINLKPNKVPVKIRYNNAGDVSIEPIPPIIIPDGDYILESKGETVFFQGDVYMRGYIIYDPKKSINNWSRREHRLGIF